MCSSSSNLTLLVFRYCYPGRKTPAKSTTPSIGDKSFLKRLYLQDSTSNCLYLNLEFFFVFLYILFFKILYLPYFFQHRMSFPLNPWPISLKGLLLLMRCFFAYFCYDRVFVKVFVCAWVKNNFKFFFLKNWYLEISILIFFNFYFLIINFNIIQLQQTPSFSLWSLNSIL